MEWIAPLLTAVLGFVSGTGVDRFRLTSRLRAEISSDLDIAQKLPSGPAREELEGHITKRTRLLIIESQSPNYMETYLTKMGSMFVIVGVPAVVTASIAMAVGARSGDGLVAALLLVGVVATIAGSVTMLAGIKPQYIRRVTRRLDLDSE